MVLVSYLHTENLFLCLWHQIQKRLKYRMEIVSLQHRLGPRSLHHESSNVKTMVCVCVCNYIYTHIHYYTHTYTHMETCLGQC